MNAQQTDRTISATPLLRLHLFGGFAATRDNGPAPAERWTRPSAQTLVKLLAVVPDHQLHREQAMDICWPDADQQSATGSLRVALHAARRALEPELAPRASSSYLISDGALLRLDPATVRIDADEAETAARAALASGDAGDLAAALTMFTGELLPEDRYASWAQARRDHLVALREEVQLALAAAHMAQGSHAEAVAVAEQVLAASPAEELAHRIVIDACLRQGLRRRAVHHYHVCRAALDAELGVRPGPETERLHRKALTAGPAAAPAGPTLPAPLRAPAGTPLRGRDEHLARLLTAGGPPVTLLGGEAGVGKTRLAGEIARRAAEAGAAVLWGGGHDAEGHTPYGAFAEALDGWLADRDAGERARVGAEYPELAAFLPSLGRVRDGERRSPEEERDRLFRATSGLLGELAAARPLLVVLDDLHAADAGSYQLLSHLARRAATTRTALRFLVTYREEEVPEGDARRLALAQLTRQRLLGREELGRLDREACLAVVRDAAPGPDDRFGRVWELSLGNPLFALELARGPVGDEAPDGVRELVGERLGRLGRDTRRVVEALAVGGGEAALTELLDVAAHGLRPAVDAASAADAIEDAISAALVEERKVVVAGRAEAGLAFRHPLVRLTCYEGLSSVRRRQLHAAFAQTVLRRRPDAVDTLASHFARADDPRAAEYLRRAAERAAAVYANDTADRYYRDLVARLDVDAARARLAHAQVLRRMGHFAEAAAVLRLALAEFVRRGDHDDTVLAAARLAETLVKAEDPESGREILDTHPPAEDTGPEPTASHLLALSVALSVQGHYTEGYAAARQALAPARRVPGLTGQGLLARCHATQATNLALAGRFGEAREAADLAFAPAEAYGDSALLGSVLSVLRENARRGGRLREAVDTGLRALDRAEESGDPTAAAFERANLAELRLLLEEVDAARDLAEAAVAGADPDEAWSLPYALAALARVRMRAGAPDRAAPLLDRAERVAGTHRDRQARFEVGTARAELALLQGRPEQVAVLLPDDEAPVLAAWGRLLAGDRGAARRIAAAEVERALGTGERLAEVEARVVHAVALPGAAGRAALADAGALARSLPYPAGLRRIEQARGLQRA
ncbi:AAA family ATPase [Streptomyces sp. NBC_00401]|uniref:ATP-binding protein n=1 Tax=Streptomyces sp. NBC_00401 TaxID=2975738 RepID=UPI00225B9569|nr:AAA family ATPase [Streptomyces sp. NBC_00401]MCX5080714.1 AAA family ATPase [Streptomyces sp. NBC_00401]